MSLVTVPCNQELLTKMQTVLIHQQLQNHNQCPYQEPALPTLALQAVTGQGELVWQGAMHGWPQSALGVEQGCLQASSTRHSPL